MRWWWLGLVAACGGAANPPADDTPETADELPTLPEGVWNGALPDAAGLAPVRGLVPRRAVFHLHSPFSHDACDNKGWVDGVLDTSCRDDLRSALCTLRFDAAFLTDHPDYGDRQPFESLFHPAPGDALVRDGERLLRSEIACEGGHTLRWMAGFEDFLMPVGLHGHVHDDPATRNQLLNGGDRVAQDAMRAAGGRVLAAHVEGRALEDLQRLQDDGLHGLEVFNLHAMFAPNLRPLLGLDGFGWAADIGPFIAQEEGLQPDLFVLAVLAEQRVTVERIDALLQRGNLMLTGGTDAHQNVLAADLADGERGDSYRRMLRWFSTMLLATDASPEALDAAVAAKRSYVAFEILGTPEGVDLHHEAADGTITEMGADTSATSGTIVVGCPTLADGSPYGPEAPEVEVRVIQDGQPWKTGCGRFDAGPGVYRVEVWSTPRHLAPFLGTDPSRWMRAYPWVYTSAVRVGL